jgi:hypothetical protein
LSGGLLLVNAASDICSFSLELYTMRGQRLFRLPKRAIQAGAHLIPFTTVKNNGYENQVCVVRVFVENTMFTEKIILRSGFNKNPNGPGSSGMEKKKSTPADTAVDTLIVSKKGYQSEAIPIFTYIDSWIITLRRASSAPGAPAISSFPLPIRDQKPTWTWHSGGNGNGRYRY